MKTPLHVLVAEDEIGDVLLLERAFAKAGVSAPVYVAADGEEVTLRESRHSIIRSIIHCRICYY